LLSEASSQVQFLVLNGQNGIDKRVICAHTP
jgi:hypothetical protein